MILDFNYSDVKLIKNGRFFNVDGKLLIMSRNRNESDVLKNYDNDNFIKVELPEGLGGPVAFIDKNTLFHLDIELMLKIVLSYTKTFESSYKMKFNGKEYDIKVEHKSNFKQHILN